MIYEHEIPSGGKLYFGETAKLKRELESKASALLSEAGFEEILTPFFSYGTHQAMDETRAMIRLSDEDNEPVVLRADSSLDVVRLIQKRLGRATDHTRWFYIQPVFRHPTTEIHQIGAEIMGCDDAAIAAVLALGILEQIGRQPVLELSNVRIAHLAANEAGIDPEWVKDGNVAAMRRLGIGWLDELIAVHTPSDARHVAALCPAPIAEELLDLAATAARIGYDRTVLYPLYAADMRYYDRTVFRLLSDNDLLATGGSYRHDGNSAVGFALYTDSIIENLGKGKE